MLTSADRTQCFYFLWICICVRFVHLWALKAVCFSGVLVTMWFPTASACQPWEKEQQAHQETLLALADGIYFQDKNNWIRASQVKGKEEYLNSWLLNWTGLGAAFVLFCFVFLFLRLAMTACQDLGRQMSRRTCTHPTILWVPGCVSSLLQHEETGWEQVTVQPYSPAELLLLTLLSSMKSTLLDSSYCLCSNYIHDLC